MHTRIECRILTSAKLKQYHYLHARFLEEIQYILYLFKLEANLESLE